MFSSMFNVIPCFPKHFLGDHINSKKVTGKQNKTEEFSFFL